MSAVLILVLGILLIVVDNWLRRLSVAETAGILLVAYALSLLL
jgi:hypothetical protein